MSSTAVDLNPVAWFALTCTLDWPRRLAGRRRPLPAFARGDRAFMTTFQRRPGPRAGAGAGGARPRVLHGLLPAAGVGRMLTKDGEEMVSGLDDVTTCYLLHRYDFGLGDAPAGAGILYALSCRAPAAPGAGSTWVTPSGARTATPGRP